MKNIIKILSYSKQFKRKFILSLFLALFATALDTYAPFLIGQTIDQMIKGGTSFELIIKNVIILIVIALISQFINYFVNILSSRATNTAMFDLRKRCMDKILNAELSSLDKFSSGDLSARMGQDADNVALGVRSGMLSLVKGVGVLIFTIAIMLYLNFRMALVVIVLTPLTIVVAFVITKNSKKQFDMNAEKLAKINSFSYENMKNQDILLMNGFEVNCEKEFNDLIKEWEPSADKSHFFSALVNPTSRIVNNTIYILTGLVGVLLSISVGNISTFLLYSTQYSKPFNEISAVVGEIQTGIASAKRITELLNIEVKEEEQEKEINEKIESITFEDVDFSYSHEKELIKGLSLNVKKGQTVAIVGTTGAGKTTLINLILRFYKAQSGKICLNDININDLNKRSLREKISVVFQDSFILNDTIHNNIAFYSQMTREEVEKVAKSAYCYDFIKALPKGFDTKISSSSLSLGQMQLICIARAMAEDSQILILDEATSAIDSLTEIKIQQAFNKLKVGKTSFIIAHRLSTIKNSDLILVMDKGNVVESGTDTELMDKKGLYYHLNIVGFSN